MYIACIYNSMDFYRLHHVLAFSLLGLESMVHHYNHSFSSHSTNLLPLDLLCALGKTPILIKSSSMPTQFLLLHSKPYDCITFNSWPGALNWHLVLGGKNTKFSFLLLGTSIFLSSLLKIPTYLLSSSFSVNDPSSTC